MPSVRHLGILTAGGDCPGLNAVIRAVVKSARRCSPSVEMTGFLDGYAGLVEGRTRPLGDEDVSGILPRGGTILGTSNRDNPFKYLRAGSSTPEDCTKQVLANIERAHLDGLITVGGEGTLSCALRLSELGVPVIGVPKTIDNDLGSTDVTFGFDTALTIATEAVDRLHTTAESHHRVLICEVMGRYAGWIALRAGIAGGGDVILIPEIPFRIDAVCRALNERVREGKKFSILVVAEGAQPEGGAPMHLEQTPRKRKSDLRPRLGGISHWVAEQIEDQTGFETRVVILGHLQRGGTPTAFDRWLATQFGFHAVEHAVQGHWGNMVALQGTRFKGVPIADAVRELRRVDRSDDSIRAAKAVGTSFGE